MKRIVVLFSVMGLFAIGCLYMFPEFGFGAAWWISPVLHTIGGFLAALLTGLVWQYFDHRSYRNSYVETRLIGILFGTVVFGVAWEVFEFVFFKPLIVKTVLDLFYHEDTIQDLLVDAFGGVFGGLLFLHWKS